jgi:hypothetical protein
MARPHASSRISQNREGPAFYLIDPKWSGRSKPEA